MRVWQEIEGEEVAGINVASCITEYVRALLPVRVIGTRFLNWMVSRPSFHQWEWLGEQAFVKRALMQVWLEDRNIVRTDIYPFAQCCDLYQRNE